MKSRRSLQKLMDLSGRRALITGGAGHIGLAAAETLIELGARVALADVNLECMTSRAQQLGGFLESDSFALEVDLLNEGTTRSVIQQAISKMGGLDIFIHSAGYVGTTDVPGWAEPFENQQVSAWDAALRVNLTSAFLIVQEAKNALCAKGCGSVIFISSIYGVVGPDMRLYHGTDMANPAGYNASKGGLLQLMRYMAAILAPEIRVNAISPGGVWRNQPEAFQERYKERTPLRRMATEEDFKGAVAYLASDLSGYVTGHNLMIDGGWTIW